MPDGRAATTRTRRPRPRCCGVTVQRQLMYSSCCSAAGSRSPPIGSQARSASIKKPPSGARSRTDSARVINASGRCAMPRPLMSNRISPSISVAADADLRRRGCAQPHAARDGLHQRTVPALAAGPLPWCRLAADEDARRAAHRWSCGWPGRQPRVASVGPRCALRGRFGKPGGAAGAAGAARRQWRTWRASPGCKARWDGPGVAAAAAEASARRRRLGAAGGGGASRRRWPGEALGAGRRGRRAACPVRSSSSAASSGRCVGLWRRGATAGVMARAATSRALQGAAGGRVLRSGRLCRLWPPCAAGCASAPPPGFRRSTGGSWRFGGLG